MTSDVRKLSAKELLARIELMEKQLNEAETPGEVFTTKRYLDALRAERTRRHI